MLERPVLLAHTSHAHLIRVLAGQALQAADGLQLLQHVQDLLVLLWILAKQLLVLSFQIAAESVARLPVRIL